jgi:hypothetical protein
MAVQEPVILCFVSGLDQPALLQIHFIIYSTVHTTLLKNIYIILQLGPCCHAYTISLSCADSLHLGEYFSNKFLVHQQNVEVTNAESTKRRTTKHRMGHNAE